MSTLLNEISVYVGYLSDISKIADNCWKCHKDVNIFYEIFQDFAQIAIGDVPLKNCFKNFIPFSPEKG